jgi:hypothetical protein
MSTNPGPAALRLTPSSGIRSFSRLASLPGDHPTPRFRESLFEKKKRDSLKKFDKLSLLMEYPMRIRNYFFSGAGAGAGAGVSAFFSSPAGAGAGAGSGAFCSAAGAGGGASSFFLQPMAKEKTTNNITTSTKEIIFRISIHLLCLI